MNNTKLGVLTFRVVKNLGIPLQLALHISVLYPQILPAVDCFVLWYKFLFFLIYLFLKKKKKNPHVR